MKRRPRRIEQKAAEHLSAFFDTVGMAGVARVPVIGRTGPDIEINEFGLIVDVKSRISVPTASFPGSAHNRQLAWTTLDQLGGFAAANITVSDAGKSKMAKDWLDHMDAWTAVHYPQWRKDHGEARFPAAGISAIVLHKAAKVKEAKMPVGQAVFVMYTEDLELFKQRYTKFLEKGKKL